MALQMFACTVTQNLCHVSASPAEIMDDPVVHRRRANATSRRRSRDSAFSFFFFFLPQNFSFV